MAIDDVAIFYDNACFLPESGGVSAAMVNIKTIIPFK